MTNIDDIQSELSAARADLLDALEGVTQEQIDRRPPGEITDDEQRWPITDVLWHVGHTEDRFRRTIDQALGGRDVAMEPVRARPAHLTTLPLLLEWLEQSRRPTETLLRQMTDEQLEFEIPRPDGTTRTPLRYLEILVSHDHAHADQVRALKALPAS